MVQDKVNSTSWERNAYDYFDFGCSKGGNIEYIHQYWPDLVGVGIDIDENKIKQAQANSHNAIIYDILALPNKKLCRFVTMSHFLEHLDSVSHAQKIIKKGIDIAESFLVIRQPYFDADSYLFNKNLKFYWSHWHGHRNRMDSLDFYTILNKELLGNRIQSFEVYGNVKVTSSDASTVIPLDAPINQHHYNEEEHGDKDNNIAFTLPVFEEIVVKINIMEDPLSIEMRDQFKDLHLIYKSLG